MDGVKQILIKNSNNYLKPREYHRIFRALFGSGLLTHEGDDHVFHRRLCQPAFNISSMVDMMKIFNLCGERLMTRWEARLEEHKQALISNPNAPCEVNVAPELVKVSLDILGLAAFGKDFDSFSEKQDRLASLLSTSLEAADLSGKGMSLLIPMFDWGADVPIPSNNRRRKHAAEFGTYLSALINEKRALVEKEKASGTGSDRKRDLLDRLITANLEESDDKKITDDELTGHAVTFTFAGHETTSTLLSWALYVLSTRPAIIAKMKEEISTVLGCRTEMTIEDMDKMYYTHAVVKEVLRYHPPVHWIVREAKNDDVVAGHQVYAGSVLVVPIYMLHRSAKYWADPDTFLPERWLPKSAVSGESDFRNLPSPSPAYLPFSLGPKNCIGQSMAMLEARVILAKIFQRFDIQLKDGFVASPKVSITTRVWPPGPILNLSPSSL